MVTGDPSEERRVSGRVTSHGSRPAGLSRQRRHNRYLCHPGLSLCVRNRSKSRHVRRTPTDVASIKTPRQLPVAPSVRRHRVTSHNSPAFLPLRAWAVRSVFSRKDWIYSYCQKTEPPRPLHVRHVNRIGSLLVVTD